MYTLFIVALITVLIWQRKKIHWPGVIIGVALTVMLMPTPLGPPLNSMVQGLANGFTTAASSVIHAGGVK